MEVSIFKEEENPTESPDSTEDGASSSSKQPNSLPIFTYQPQPGNSYPAIFAKARKGVHPVLLHKFTAYDKDGNDVELCFAFQFKRKTPTGLDFCCVYCKSLKCTARVKVVDGMFLENPASMQHVCSPKLWAEESVKRTLYEKLQELRSTPQTKTPKEAYDELMQNIEGKHGDAAALGPYESHRRAFSNAVNTMKRARRAPSADEVTSNGGEMAEEEPYEEVKAKKRCDGSIDAHLLLEEDIKLEEPDEIPESSAEPSSSTSQPSQSPSTSKNSKEQEKSLLRSLLVNGNSDSPVEEPVSMEAQPQLESPAKMLSEGPTKGQILEYLDQIKLFVMKNF